ncbi:MAG: translation initiation factor IF-3 [Patescibacteria group bacterium]|nr:translation initiation factor IF-3 [Patescibacteria group bacterium]MDD5490764.1 translation initiation factor IF-3 [Patescibacteria group bacterium]
MRRIRRKPKVIQKAELNYELNEQIHAPEVRVIDDTARHLGVMPLAKALALAKEKESDLININPSSVPPTVKITDFGKFKYQKEKEFKKQKQASKPTEIKGIRLSSRIGSHDLEIRMIQGKNFLERGDKLKIEIILRGRERQHADVAIETIQKFLNELSKQIEIKLEQPPKRLGNQVTAIVDKKNK